MKRRTCNKITIIAEAGWNWDADIGMARELVWAAFENRADIVKFQLYDIDKIKKPGDTNYEGLKIHQLSRDDMYLLADEANKAKIEILFTAFDLERVRWLDSLHPRRYKIAGRSILDNEMKAEIASKGRPVILSVQKSFSGEYKRLKDLWPYNRNVDFLYCISRRDVLREGVVDFPESFGGRNEFSGFSDHTIGLEWAITAMERSATIIEKHITFDKNIRGWDVPSSMTPYELKRLTEYAAIFEEERNAREFNS